MLHSWWYNLTIAHPPWKCQWFNGNLSSRIEDSLNVSILSLSNSWYRQACDSYCINIDCRLSWMKNLADGMSNFAATYQLFTRQTYWYFRDYKSTQIQKFPQTSVFKSRELSTLQFWVKVFLLGSIERAVSWRSGRTTMHYQPKSTQKLFLCAMQLVSFL